MKNKLAVVYGGSGFLGLHVANALANGGMDVRIADLQRPPLQGDRFDFVPTNLEDPAAVMAAAEGAAYVYNFAGIADIDEAREDPVNTAQINVVGNLHVMEAARAVGAERFLFASSVYVYSQSGSFYRASKQAAEAFIEVYKDRYGLPFTILRYGSLYGRRADTRNSIHRMVREALTDGTITYGGDENAVREYIHVSDAALLSVKALEPEFANRHLILTGTERMRVCDVMQIIAEMLPNSIELKYRDGDPESHYVMTPYGFHPRLGHKLTANDFVDLGQGLLDCLSEAHTEKSDGTEGETVVRISELREPGKP